MVFICTMAGSPAAAEAPTQLPLPSAANRAMPPVKPAGVAPITLNPKYTFPAVSLTRGVLMMTLAS